MTEKVTVIGAGLAGSEAAWQLAKRGIKVDLYEMRPKKMTPAHESGNFAELVCTNSMRSNQLSNAVGLLKEEMRQMDSLIMQAADACQVPAGGALAVDRELFSKYVTDKLTSLPEVIIHDEEITDLPSEGITVIATGPLTSDSLAEKIQDFEGAESLKASTSLTLPLQSSRLTPLTWTSFTRRVVMTGAKPPTSTAR